jgi:hypothetical protein
MFYCSLGKKESGLNVPEMVFGGDLVRFTFLKGKTGVTG